MKARKLKSLLNNTGYAICNADEYIIVGSPMCYNLISVNKETLRVKYALDGYGKGRDALLGKHQEELLFIWDKLHELIASGEIHDIINGRDVIENPLPVFSVKGSQLIESVTDAYGWPNTDDDGEIMYENTHFPTREAAIRAGIEEANAGEHILSREITSVTERLADLHKRLAQERANIVTLEAMLLPAPDQ